MLPKSIHSQSDKDYIENRLQYIPDDMKQAVCDKYDSIFMSNRSPTHRKLANEYLRGVTAEYQSIKLRIIK